MNSGGDLLVSPGIGAWFRDPVRGAALDVIDFAVLLGAWLVLGHRRRPPAVVFCSALMLAGWTSNLLDRLGLHYWTAPHSVRGVVDFIPWQRRYWNVADLVIIAGTAGLAVTTVVLAGRAAVTPRRRRAARRGRPLLAGRTRMAAAGSVLTAAVLAAIGSVAYAGVSEPIVLATGR
jgi:hypothetical protein